VAIAATRDGRRQLAADRWFRARRAEELYISALTMGELNRSVFALAHADVHTADRLAAWLQTLLRLFEGRVLDVTGEIADRWGTWPEAQGLDAIDGLVAATAQLYGLTLVTAEAERYAGLDLPIIDPWADQASMPA
jgi:hypothetical protein